MYGFRNNKRIVLFDTLIASECTGENEGKGCEDDEIIAVLGHELGHWKMGHTVKMLVINEALIFLIFYCFRLVLSFIYIFNYKLHLVYQSTTLNSLTHLDFLVMQPPEYTLNY